jgi:hypothetical protein
MKLALASFLSLCALAAITGCASQKPAKSVVVEQAAGMDTTDPSFQPPDESGMAVDEKKIDSSPNAGTSKKGKSADGTPMKVGIPGRSGHSGTVHSAK